MFTEAWLKLRIKKMHITTRTDNQNDSRLPNTTDGGALNFLTISEIHNKRYRFRVTVERRIEDRL